MAKVLTQIGIEKLKASSKRLEVPDAAFSGLYIIIQPSGVKSFAYRFRYAGKTKKLTLGRFPKISLAEARERAEKAFKQIERGLDPSARNNLPEAFDEAFREFLARHVSQNKSYYEIERQFNHDFLPIFRSTPINQIRKRDVVRLLDQVLDRGSPVMANRLRATLSKFYSWANARDLTDQNPCSGISRPSKEITRERVLSESEIQNLWKAADALRNKDQRQTAYGRYFQFLLLSGQRRGEVAYMKYEELDGDTWLIPAERTKNNKLHAVPMTKRMKALINYTDQATGFVFSITGKNPINNIDRATNKLRLIMYELAKKPIMHWRLHDLRRTAASEMAREGVFVEVIEKLQNRSTGKLSGVAGIYNRYDYADEKREALELWNQTVERCISK